MDYLLADGGGVSESGTSVLHCDSLRGQLLNAFKVSNYFEVLGTVLDEADLHSRPHCIWNMDESGVQLDYKPGKVLAARGQGTCTAAPVRTAEL